MREIKYPKMREARLRQWHGENWSEEDQKEFEKERNRRQCSKHRDAHREEYTNYQREYQRRYRERHRYLYGWMAWNRNHPDNQMSLDEYINYRQNKERMKEIENDR